jgi:hypothetical protein
MTKTTNATRTTRTEKPAKAKATPAPKTEAKPADPKQVLAGLRSGDLRYTESRLALVAQAGMVPPAPNFEAETHKRFRGKLAIIQKAVEAKDMKALADPDQPGQLIPARDAPISRRSPSRPPGAGRERQGPEGATGEEGEGRAGDPGIGAGTRRADDGDVARLIGVE